MCIMGQNFEGVLTYSMTIEFSGNMEGVVPNVDVYKKKLKETASFSKETTYTYKGGDYRVDMVDTGTTMIYRNKENTIYTKERNYNKFIVTEADIDLEKQMFGALPDIAQVETDVTILGRKCNKVVISYRAGVYEYYYAKGFLKMDPVLYKGHTYNRWYEFLKISNALPLRIVKNTLGMSVIMDVVKIDTTEIDMKLFDIPKINLNKEMSRSVPENQKVYYID